MKMGYMSWIFSLFPVTPHFLIFAGFKTGTFIMEFCVVWKQVLLTSQEADFMVERIMSFPVEQV
jgi:hypothetical protein